MEEEFKYFKDAFVCVAEELCGRTSGKEILTRKKQRNLMDRRSSGSNRRKERDMEVDRSDQGVRGTTEHNITATVRTEEGGGQERCGRSKEGSGGGIVEKVRRGLFKEVDI